MSQNNEDSKLATLLDNALDGIIVYKNDKMIYISPILSQLIEYSREEIMKEGDLIFAVSEEEKPRVQEIIKERESKKRKSSTYETILISKTGRSIPMEIRTMRLQFDKVDYFIVNFRDITKQKQALEKLKKVQANQGKLFSEIAHSLKTPFTVIKGLTELYSEVNTLTEAKSIFSMIKTEVDTADVKLNDLLKIAKMDMTDYQLNFTLVKSKKYLEAVYIKGKSLGYKYCNFDHDNNCTCFLIKGIEEGNIQIDKTAIMDVLMTIIENAYMHSPKKGQKAKIELTAKKKGRDYQIVIRDYGKGLSPRQIDRVFEPFAGTRTRTLGHGIGLPMSKKIIESHKGTIRLDTKVKHGTKVIIDLPLYE